MISSIHAVVSAHVLQFSIVICIVAIVIRLTGRRWPHFAFLICMLALAKCLVPPVISSPAGLFTLHSSVAFSPNYSTLSNEEIVLLKQNAASLPTTQELQAIQHALDGGRASGPLRMSWQFWIATVWVVGACGVLLRAMWQYSQVVRVLGRTIPAPREIRDLTSRLSTELGLRRAVHVVVSDENYGPACVGLMRPKLVLPKALVTGWSDRLLQPVIAHELVHARRGDVVWGYMQFAAQVLWWFHPLVWWLGRRAQLLCERCCDEEVVSSLKCSAADYAESLVRVLEMRTVYRPVPLAHGMSPAEITGQRLERLLKRCGRFSRRTSGRVWLLAGLLAVVVIPGMRWANSQQRLYSSQSEQNIRQEINSAIEQCQWEKAIELLGPLVLADPKNASATFFLGYALHASGEIDAALPYHVRAAEFPSVRRVALYNWGCALALQGQPLAAMSKLEESVVEGFLPDLEDDADLNSLRKLPRFVALKQRIDSQRVPCEELEQFDFLVGSWTVVDGQGRTVGENTFSKSDKGHVVTERWQSATGRTGTSINYYHLGQQKWKQTWVDDAGGVVEYEGTYVDGKMKFEGTMVMPDGREFQTRMTFVPRVDGTVAQLIERSEDGKAWHVFFNGCFERQRMVQVNDKTIGSL